MQDRASKASTKYAGFRDVSLRVKANVPGNDGSPVASAVAPHYEISTVTRGLGNGAGEFGVLIPIALSLLCGLTTAAITEFDDLKNADNAGQHAGFVNIVNLSHTLAPTLTGAIELFSQSEATHIPEQYTLDLALAYLLELGTQVDTAAYVGLNEAAPNIVAYVGLSQRF